MYRTGDLGRWLSDGTIEYLGRNDFQVKLRGFRIELGEIESELSACAGVRAAVVLAREDTPGDKRLVAYVVPSEGETPAVADLRAALAAALPDYMVPAAFVRLDALPLTPNGKLDRKALPAPDQSSVAMQNYEAPLGPVETAIATIWQEILGVERVGRNDHFFELGGHSLLAVQFVVRAKASALEFTLGDLLTCPRVSQLATRIDIAQPLQPTVPGSPGRWRTRLRQPIGRCTACRLAGVRHLGCWPVPRRATVRRNRSNGRRLCCRDSRCAATWPILRCRLVVWRHRRLRNSNPIAGCRRNGGLCWHVRQRRANPSLCRGLVASR
jgi:hypothetical protein